MEVWVLLRTSGSSGGSGTAVGGNSVTESSTDALLEMEMFQYHFFLPDTDTNP